MKMKLTVRVPSDALTPEKIKQLLEYEEFLKRAGNVTRQFSGFRMQKLFHIQVFYKPNKKAGTVNWNGYLHF